MQTKEKERKKHTAIYLPPDLLRRLALYQLKKTGTSYGRNAIIIQAIEEYLRKSK